MAMSIRKAAFFEACGAEEEMLRTEVERTGALKGFQADMACEKLSAATARLAAGAEIVSVFVNSVVDKAVIDALAAGGTRLIVTRSTGFDHIDCAYATSRGIAVANVPAYGSRTVAEYAFALILGLSRKTFEAVHRVKNEAEFDVYGLMGFDLQGKTIGVVGTGRIGQNAAMIARGFGMEVIAYDLFQNADAAAKIGFSYVSLDELLSRSDVITLHVPFTPETKHLINTANIRRAKRGAILVNTARGEVCDTEALLMGVNEGILSGVGLDVVEGERRLRDDAAHLFTRLEDEALHPDQRKRLHEYRELMKKPNVYLTPHIAYYSAEAQREIVKTTIEDIAAFIARAPKNVVG